MPWYNKLLTPLAIVVAIIATGIAYSQTVGGSSGASQDYVNSAIASVIAAMPTPVATIPPGPAGNGITGSGLGYVPGNAAQRQGVQRINIVTDASGNWAVTWATSFLSATPTVAVNPLNTSAVTNGPTICNVITRNATTASGRCWQTGTALVILSLNVLGSYVTPTTGMPIMVVAAEPTQ